METIRTYGKGPYQTALLHGGPGAAGEMKPVAEHLSKELGVLELLQTAKTVEGQVEELYRQLTTGADLPVVLIGYSWGAWLGFLFAARYSDLVKKLILVGAGAFDPKLNQNLMDIRLERLSGQQRQEAVKLLAAIQSDDDNEALRRFGELMTMADSYSYLPGNTPPVEVDMAIHRSVWAEASHLRDTNQLILHAGNIRCPVVAIHGEHDPHPAEGVEGPLSGKLADFKMIRMEKCGHTPWVEREARDGFFELLRSEVG